MGTLKCPQLKKIIKNRFLEIAFQFFVSAFLGCYFSCKKLTNSLRALDFFLNFFSKLAARTLDVWAGVCLDFFHATDFRGSEHSEEKVYEVYILFELSWSAVSIGTGAASYKQLVQVSPIESFLELLRVYLYSVVP